MNKLSILIIAALFFSSCGGYIDKFDATGAFEATEVVVSSEANGKIMELNIKEGEVVEAGKNLGYVDSAQLYLKKMQLGAGMKAIDMRKPDIRKQIAVLEQQIATARIEQRRMMNLVESKAGNQKHVDDITHQIDFLTKQLDAQRSTLGKTSTGMDAEVEGLLYQIMQLDDQLQKCTISSPLTGTILVKYAQAGEITGFGKPLFKIADINLLYLRAYITSAQLSGLKIGQEVKVFADAGHREPQREYSGAVTWISDKAEFTPKGIQTKDERANLVYAIKIAVKNDGYLKKGQYGEIIFK
jgi:HlyD family secretion protein